MAPRSELLGMPRQPSSPSSRRGTSGSRRRRWAARRAETPRRRPAATASRTGAGRRASSTSSRATRVACRRRPPGWPPAAAPRRRRTGRSPPPRRRCRRAGWGCRRCSAPGRSAGRCRPGPARGRAAGSSRPRSGEAPSTDETVANATTISAKYSAGPKRSAISASAGAATVRPTMPRVPATNEPIAAVASAADARPACAIRCPSMAVMMAPLSPGVFMRIDVVDPPYMAPAYTPANMMNAPTGPSWNVTGSSSATVRAGPDAGQDADDRFPARPRRTPTAGSRPGARPRIPAGAPRSIPSDGRLAGNCTVVWAKRPLPPRRASAGAARGERVPASGRRGFGAQPRLIEAREGRSDAGLRERAGARHGWRTAATAPTRHPPHRPLAAGGRGLGGPPRRWHRNGSRAGHAASPGPSGRPSSTAPSSRPTGTCFSSTDPGRSRAG